MIVTRLSGGLGNQMFQYALALRMADRLQTELKLDLSFYNTPPPLDVTPREYELKVWGIDVATASTEEVHSFINRPRRSIWNKITGNTGDKTWYKEKRFSFDPEVLKLNGDIYLDGYWQSEKYFKEVEPAIREAYRLKSNPDEVNFQLGKDMQACESVAVHVRRVDYLKTPEILAFHGVLEASYYQEAIRRLQEKHKGLQLFVFSDAPDWVRDHLKFDLPTTMVDHNRGKNSYLDLWLMSQCKHQVLANSSFSWWGAWLNTNPSKIVIGPAQWFSGKGLDTKDLTPPEWIRL